MQRHHICPAVLALATGLAAAFLAVLATGAAGAPVGADRGSAAVTGALKGVPAKAEGMRTASVRAIDAQRGTITDAALVPPSLRFRLDVPRGWQLVLGEVVDSRGGEYRGASRLVRIDRARRVDVTVKRIRRALQGFARAESGTAGAAVRPVVTWSKMQLTDRNGGVVARIDGFAYTEMLDVMAAECDAVWVDTTPETREAIAREIALQRAGATGTKLRFRPIQARYRVVGSGRATPSGSYSVSVRVIDSKSGKTVASRRVSGSGESFLRDLAEMFRQLGRDACRPEYTRIVGTFEGTATDPVYKSTTTWSGKATFVASGTQTGPDRKPWQQFSLLSAQVTVRSSGGMPCALQAGPATFTFADRGEMLVQLTQEQGKQRLYSGTVHTSPADTMTAQIVCPAGTVDIPGWYHAGAYMSTGAVEFMRAAPGGRLEGTATVREQNWRWKFELE